MLPILGSSFSHFFDGRRNTSRWSYTVYQAACRGPSGHSFSPKHTPFMFFTHILLNYASRSGLVAFVLPNFALDFYHEVMPQATLDQQGVQVIVHGHARPCWLFEQRPSTQNTAALCYLYQRTFERICNGEDAHVMLRVRPTAILTSWAVIRRVPKHRFEMAMRHSFSPREYARHHGPLGNPAVADLFTGALGGNGASVWSTPRKRQCGAACVQYCFRASDVQESRQESSLSCQG